MINILTDLATSILAIKSDAQVSIIDEDINQITWVDGNPTNITNEQILEKQAELQTEYDAQDYARNREKEYPKIGDQLDYIYHNGITKWKTDMITPVKEKYQKP
jgi:hypothetical protein|tara:strand:+ start:793 stop:1104 length:312 start_codon:yes stop_codon:yes gene_type:complete